MKKEIFFMVRSTHDGIFAKWMFTEVHRENDYGNGNFIGVYRNGVFETVIDVRYINYDFVTFCEKFLKKYYGENLLSCSKM